MGEEPFLDALERALSRFGVETHAIAFPEDLAVRAQRQAPGVGKCEIRFGQGQEFLREGRAVDDENHLGVDPERPGIEIGAADHGATPVDDHVFRMKPQMLLRDRRQDIARAAVGEGADLVYLGAKTEKFGDVPAIGRIGGDVVVRVDRVGQ